MTRRCEICRGAGVVRHPRYRDVAEKYDAAALSVECDYKVYPCPECGPSEPSERVNIMRVFAMFDIPDETAGADFLNHAKVGVAHRLVSEMLKSGIISFEERPS